MFGLYQCIFICGTLFVAAGCTRSAEVVRINPPGVFDTTKLGFPQVLITSRKNLVFTNSVAMDTDMNVVGEGDLDAQLKKALSNLSILLDAAGAKPDDIAQMRVNVVDLDDQSRHIVIRNLNEYYGKSERASNALIGVDRLARPDLLVEIEVIAAVD